MARPLCTPGYRHDGFNAIVLSALKGASQHVLRSHCFLASIILLAGLPYRTLRHATPQAQGL